MIYPGGGYETVAEAVVVRVPVLPKISQETLAEIDRHDTSSHQLFMNRFRRLGLINYNGKIEVYRSLLNMVLNERPGIRS